jgi:PAS domain S-box-containing protein
VPSPTPEHVLETGTTESGWASLFWQAFRQSRNAMVLLDDDRRCVDVNGACLRLVGFRREALIGRHIWEFFDQGPLLTVAEWQQAMSRAQFTGIVDVLRADGGRVTVEFAGHPELVTGKWLVLGVATRTSRRGRQSTDDTSPARIGALSKREREIVRLLAHGASGPEIADELHLAHNTVRTHVRNAMTKLGARSRAQLVAMSLADAAHWPEAS